MRLFGFVIVLVAALPGNTFAQADPNWSQREMERMQAQQERWDAQAERQRAEQERWAAQTERQRAQRVQQRDPYDRQSQQYQALPPSPERKPTPATEHFQPIHTGNDLYSACTPDVTGNTTGANLQCMLYVGDVSFGRKVVDFKKADGANCFPQGVTLGQIKDIVFTYLRDTPGRRHINATNLTVEAIIKAFPACKVTAVR
jgi:hypothetical protein